MCLENDRSNDGHITRSNDIGTVNKYLKMRLVTTLEVTCNIKNTNIK